MRRTFQEVQVYGIQDRRATGKPKPWVVRWSVDGPQRSRAFRTKAEAERFRSLLLEATHDGDRFDMTTGEPGSWQPPLGDMMVYAWARRWLSEQWIEWQPRTRRSAVESLAKLVMLAANAQAARNSGDKPSSAPARSPCSVPRSTSSSALAAPPQRSTTSIGSG